jgi:hypothetical protein
MVPRSVDGPEQLDQSHPILLAIHGQSRRADAVDGNKRQGER